MTSVVGHISHLHENHDLKFSEIFEVLQLAFQGNLEQATEKIDGINLVFSYSQSDGIKAARSMSDIKTFGMSSTELSTKFIDRGNVRTAFLEGFKTLEKAIEVIPEHDKIRIFGTKLNRWFSIEIVYSKMNNTINYDGDYIVFHSYPIFELNHGVVLRSSNKEAANLLNVYVKKMQTAVKARNWKVSGTAVLNLKQMTNGTSLDKALNDIRSVMTVANVGEDATIRDYIHGMALNSLESMSFEPNVADAIANRIAKVQGAPTLVQIKKMVNVNKRDVVDSFVKNEIELRNTWIKPIERAIQVFTTDLLSGIQSTLIDNADVQTKRLKNRLVAAIDAIRNSGNEEAINVLNTQLARLQDLDTTISSCEGIVFTYKGQTYKFTGSFAPLNKIMGLFTFGPLSSLDFDVNRASNI